MGVTQAHAATKYSEAGALFS